MDDRLLQDLALPSAYPFRVERIDVVQTHISVVFLAGDYVYKIKKPINLGFLDFSTLERRHYFCTQEVRLNRRLAEDVYLGVVAITEDHGALVVEGKGKTIEWAVKMRRLNPQATLESRLRHANVGGAEFQAFASLLARFHRNAERNPEVSAFGRFQVVAGNMRENFTQTKNHVGQTVSAEVYQRLNAWTETQLSFHARTIEARAERQVPCDTHGDLHLDHVYYFPENAEEDRWRIIDCIEFSDRFRFADPIADVAFSVMDLLRVGRPDLAATFSDAYFQASGDVEGRSLLPLYTAYRAIVRGKVKGIEALEREVPPAARERALRRAQGFWLLAMQSLDPPSQRPHMVLMAGLPGTGKSTLAQQLAAKESFTVVRSDVLRRTLPTDGDRYSEEASHRIYTELLKQATEILWRGGRVIVDANFRHRSQRAPFLAAARAWNVPTLILECRAEEPEIKRRLDQRHGDPSEATWETYVRLAPSWEAIEANEGPHEIRGSTNSAPEGCN